MLLDRLAGYTMFRFFMLSVLLALAIAPLAATGAQKHKLPRLTQKLEDAMEATPGGSIRNGNATFTNLLFRNGTQQSILVVEGNNGSERVLHVRPGAGMSPESNIGVGPHNLGNAAVEGKYLVIGHGPPEMYWNPQNNQNEAKQQGLEAATKNAQFIIEKSQNVLGGKPYDLHGISWGATEVADYLSRDPYDGFRRAILFDPYPIHESAEKKELTEQTLLGYQRLGKKGRHLIDIFGRVRALHELAEANKDGDSGFSRGGLLKGNFTNKNLLGFILVNTNMTPDPETGMTRWYFNPGFFAGKYTFNPQDPTLDDFTLAHTSYETVEQALDVIGSGAYPTRKMEDLFSTALDGANGGYQIDYGKIKGKVMIVTAELGLGPSGSLAKRMGGAEVTSEQIEGRGHADIIYEQDGPALEILRRRPTALTHKSRLANRALRLRGF